MGNSFQPLRHPGPASSVPAAVPLWAPHTASTGSQAGSQQLLAFFCNVEKKISRSTHPIFRRVNRLIILSFFFPPSSLITVEGDIGTIQHCVPTGEDGDECKSCIEEREEEEEEEGEEKQGEDQAPVQVCKRG